MNRLPIGRAISAARKYRKLTQHELAQRMEADRTFVSRLENGKNPNPRLNTIVRIAAALDLDLSQIIRSAERKSRESNEVSQSQGAQDGRQNSNSVEAE